MMLAEAIQKIRDLTEASKRPLKIEANGRLYTDGELKSLPQKEDTAAPMRMHTLSGLASYVESGFDLERNADRKMCLHVTDETTVVLRSQLFGDWAQREDLVQKARDEADSTRKALQAEARQEVAAQRAEWLVNLADEKTAFLDDMRVRAAEAFSDCAGVSCSC